MKRLLFAVAFFAGALIAIPVQAQMQFSAVAGIATGKMFEEDPSGDNETAEDKSLLSVILGVRMQRPLGSTLIFAPEAMYISKGYADDDSDGKIAMSYIEVPLLLRYPFETAGEIKPFVTAGPALAFQLSCNVWSADGDDKDSCDNVFNADESYKGFDAGLVFGAGVTRQKFSLSVRYDMGISNISEDSAWTAKHRVWTILLGYMLGR
jgi:hypothetical protein